MSVRAGRETALPLDDDQALLGHLPDGVARALLRVARGLDAAVGHLVAAEGRRLVHDDPAELEAVARGERGVERGCEDARLEAEAGAVRALDRLVDRVDRVDDRDGAE